MTSEKTVVDPTPIEQAKQLKLEDVWAALPYRVRSNPVIMVDLDKADCERAPATYKNFFWDPRIKKRQISLDQLLTLMLALYLQKGGSEPKVFERRWRQQLTNMPPATNLKRPRNEAQSTSDR